MEGHAERILKGVQVAPVLAASQASSAKRIFPTALQRLAKMEAHVWKVWAQTQAVFVPMDLQEDTAR